MTGSSVEKTKQNDEDLPQQREALKSNPRPFEK